MNNQTITVVGQGYVGLPLAIEASKVGFKVYGFDNDLSKIEFLLKGKSLVEDIKDAEITSSLKSENYLPTINPDVIAKSEIVLICVPTPLDIDQKPDLSALREATTLVGQYLQSGAIVIIESTIEPGTCREIILPILVGASGLKVHEFQLAYSPERVDPTNKVWRIKNTPKLVAGIDNIATYKAIQFYSKFVDSVVSCSSIEIAETAKLLENSFRLINISLINEIAMFCNKMQIDINEVISAAASKPYGFMPFYPGVGAGGHCIPVDPMYLSNKARKVGASTKLIDLAHQINLEMPIYIANRVEHQLGEISGKRILIVGISYKPNIGDIRESPVLRLILELTKRGANVSWHDDLVREWNGQTSVPLSEGFDLAIIATAHDYVNLAKLRNVPVLNTKGSI